jgi:type IV secretory pathway VirJ component
MPSLPPVAAPPSVADLPLVEVRADARADAGAGVPDDTFAVLLTGDGGWRAFDRGVAHALAQDGVPVVGWNSLRYFWRARTPGEAAADLDRVLRHYAQVYGRRRALVIGYSQGADTVPFLVNRLPPETRAAVLGVALVAPGAEAFFEFHVSHWFATPRGGTPVRPEIARLAPAPVVCIYGRADPDAACHDGAFAHVAAVPLPGGHGFDGDWAGVAAAVLAAPRLGSTPGSGRGSGS